MKQKLVGKYFLGRFYVDLFLREGTGGDFHDAPERGALPRIRVGADEKEWSFVIISLLHEAFELASDRLCARYKKTHYISSDHGEYLFNFDHPQFAQICAEVGDFLAKAVPDVATAWKKWSKSK